MARPKCNTRYHPSVPKTRLAFAEAYAEFVGAIVPRYLLADCKCGQGAKCGISRNSRAGGFMEWRFLEGVGLGNARNVGIRRTGDFLDELELGTAGNGISDF